MRNLKKVLSLVLCLAVMLSVMVVGAGAAFSDQDKIENTEAVDACSALNIINGYEDGAFHPERNIKRAEVTKMICVALNGGEEPNTSTNAKPTFTDVRGTIYAWAEGYIEACVAQGIVDGVGGNRFAPASNVTGAQLAKMLLVSLGYNATTEKFTGNAWETNVNVRASQKHLYDGLEKMDTSAPVTRDQAAQMVWNALNAYEVEYKDGVLQDKFDSVFGRITLLGDKYEAYVNVGTLTKVDNKNLEIKMSASDEADSDNKDITKFQNVGVDYSALLGQKVKVMFTKSNDVLGVYATKDNTVVVANQKDVTADGAKVKVGDTSYSLAKNLVVSIDGEEQTKAYTSSDFEKPTSPDVLTLIDSDQDNKIDYIYIQDVTVAKVTYATESQIIAGGKTYRAVDNTIAEGIAKDDWVVITANLYKDHKNIVEAEKATGKVTATKSGDPAQYKIDNQWYNKSDDKNADISNSVREGVDAEYVAVNGVLFYAERVTGTSGLQDILFVTSKTASSTKAEVMYPNGATDEIRVSDKSDTVTPGNFYEYSKSGNVYKLTNVNLAEDAYGDYSAIVDDAGTAMSKANAVALTGNAITGYKGGKTTTTTYAIDDNADVIVYGTSESRAKHITGKQLKALNATNKKLNTTDACGGFYSEIKGSDKASVIAVEYTDSDLNGDFSSLTSYANYGFITGEVGKVNGVIQFYMWNGKENVLVNSDSNESGLVAGAVVGYDGTTTDADGKITLVGASAVNATPGYIKWTDGKDFTLAKEDRTTVSYDSTGDFTTVLYVNTKEDAKVTIEGTECYAGVTDGKVAESADKDNAVTNALWVNDDLLIVDTAARALNGDGVGTHAVNIDKDNMKGLKSFQFVNKYTGETYDNDFKAYNAVYEIGYDALTDGTLTIEWKDSYGVTTTTEYPFKAGQNTTSDPQIEITIDREITKVYTTAKSETPNPSNTTVAIKSAAPALTYGGSTTFDVNIVYKNAIGETPKMEVYAKDDIARATNLVDTTVTETTPFTFITSKDETAAQGKLTQGATLGAGEYVLVVKVGAAEATQDFTVAKQKISALTINNTVTAPTSALPGTPPTLAGLPTGVTASAAPAKWSGGSGVDGALQAGDTVTATYTLSAGANYEFDTSAITSSSSVTGGALNGGVIAITGVTAQSVQITLTYNTIA